MRTTIVAWINADRFQIRFRDVLYERTGEMTVHNWGFCNSTSSRTKLSIHKSIYRPSRSLLSDFLIFASRVVNALRKLRYHQLCSPASLPTEWTQSGSLSSESSLRWYTYLSLLYMHSLTDRIMGYNRHATSRMRLLVVNLYSSQRATLYCFCQTRYVMSPFIDRARYSSTLYYLLYYISRDLKINSNTTKRMRKCPCYLNKKEDSAYFSTVLSIIFMRYFLINLYSCLDWILFVVLLQKT